MTQDEKIGQLNQSAGIVMPGIADKKRDELITQGKVGSILWLNDVKEITTFKFTNLRVSKSSMGAGDTNEASVDVTNTGSVPGDAVAQLYSSALRVCVAASPTA